MVSTLILFGHPVDQAAFEKHFAEIHRPLLLGIPRLEKLQVQRVAGAAKGDAPFHMVVVAQFDSEQAMQEGLTSEEGQVLARDMGLFASGGVTVLFCQTTMEPLNT